MNILHKFTCFTKHPDKPNKTRILYVLMWGYHQGQIRGPLLLRLPW